MHCSVVFADISLRTRFSCAFATVPFFASRGAADCRPFWLPVAFHSTALGGTWRWSNLVASALWSNRQHDACDAVQGPTSSSHASKSRLYDVYGCPLVRQHMVACFQSQHPPDMGGGQRGPRHITQRLVLPYRRCLPAALSPPCIEGLYITRVMTFNRKNQLFLIHRRTRFGTEVLETVTNFKQPMRSRCLDLSKIRVVSNLEF